MSIPLQLKRLSFEQMGSRNLLYKGYLFIATKWLGAQWQWQMRPCHASVERQVLIRAEWGGATVFVWAELDWLKEITQLFLHETNVAALSADLQIALAETAFAEMAEQIESSSKKQLRIISIQISEERCIAGNELRQLEAIAWQASCDGLQFEGELWLDERGMRYACAATQGLTRVRPGEINWNLIPLSLRFLIGTTLLTSAAFSTLRRRDVVLLDEDWLQAQEILTVIVSRHAAFRARLSGTQLVVTERLIGIMDESFDDNEFTPDEIISDLPIKLTFDLGERSITLGELQAIAPGYIFDLGRDLRQAVIIRANGMRIGEGELVDVEGRTGVGILSLSSRVV